MNALQPPISGSITVSTERTQESYGTKYPQNPIPNLHAFIIGIDNYESQKISQLSGAVSDTDLMDRFLRTELSVPSSQIVILRNEEATRAAIISQFHALRNNPNIQQLDPILIYYAGHGSEVDTPNARKLTTSKTQCIVPQDVGLPDELGNPICPIPDYTLSALLYDLAEEKGNNITVIFDCCHSASSTRGVDTSRTPSPTTSTVSLPSTGLPSLFSPSLPSPSLPSPSLLSPSIPSTGPPSPVGSVSLGGKARYTNPSTLPSLGLQLDEKILVRSVETLPRLSSTRSVLGARKLFQRGMHSHVLLAACGHSEKAYERNTGGGGYFTSQLLDHLRRNRIDKLTYKTCMDKFPTLNTPRPQNPVCEGEHVNRFFFNASVPGAHRSFIPIIHDGRAYILKAGQAQGITNNFKFSLHLDDTIGSHNPPVGTFHVWWRKEGPWLSSIFKLDPQAKRELDQLRSGADIHQPSISYNSQLLAPQPPGGIQLFTIPSDADQPSGVPFRAYARLVEPNLPTWLSVYLTDAVKRLFQGDAAQIIESKQCQVEVDSTTEAGVVIDLNSQTGSVSFSLPNSNSGTSNNSNPYLLPHTVPPNPETVKHVLCAMSQWNWHVSRTQDSPTFPNGLQLELYRLQKSDTGDDNGNLEAAPKNLNEQGVATIVASSEESYGVRVINNTDRDLYVYPFYFSTANQSIRPLFLKVHGGDQVDPALDANDDMTMGCGDDDHLPISFQPARHAGLSQDILDVGILRVFVTTSHTDFESIAQPSPFAALGWLKPGDDEFADGVQFEPKPGVAEPSKSKTEDDDLRLQIGLDPRPARIDPCKPAASPLPGFAPGVFPVFAGLPLASTKSAPASSGSAPSSAGFMSSFAGPNSPSLIVPVVDENLSEDPPDHESPDNSLLASDDEVRRGQQSPLWDVVDMKIVIRRAT